MQQALERLGMPSPELLTALLARIEALEARVAALEGAAPAASDPVRRSRAKPRSPGN